MAGSIDDDADRVRTGGQYDVIDARSRPFTRLHGGWIIGSDELVGPHVNLLQGPSVQHGHGPRGPAAAEGDISPQAVGREGYQCGLAQGWLGRTLNLSVWDILHHFYQGSN